MAIQFSSETQNIKLFFILRVETVFIVFIDLENLLKLHKITVLGLTVQVLLQYKVCATPELGPNFRKVYAAGPVLPIIGVSALPAIHMALYVTFTSVN